MSKTLEKKRKLFKQVQKIALSLLDDAQKALAQRSVATRGEGVHNARKQFKQLRAVLRMVRFGIGEKIYQRQNIALRDAGRPLSEVRDADVMIETLDDLVQHFKDQVKKGSFTKLRSRLIKRRAKIRKQVLEKEKAMTKVARFTKRIRNSIKRWPTFSDQFGIVRKGIRQVYARGQKEMDIAFKDPTAEHMHEWRKSVKYLRYQLEIIEPVWEPAIGELAKEAKDLSDALGLDHDLAVLEQLLHSEMKDACEPVEQELLTALLRQRRAELQTDATEIGPRLYTETPKQFSKRLNGYWKAWNSRSVKAAA